MLQSERLGSPRLRGREVKRTIQMAEARNKALAGFGEEYFDWLVVIDADLHTKPSHIWQLIEEVQRGRGVAMACASALQNLPDIFGRSPWSYYDTFALVDQSGRQGITGARVPLWDLNDRAAWMAGRPVSVRSAFGKFRFCPWRCYEVIMCNGSDQAVSICLAVGQVGRVMACPEVTPLVIHKNDSIAWHPTYPDRRRKQLKDFWRSALM